MNKKEQRRNIILDCLPKNIDPQIVIDSLPKMYVELKKKDLLDGLSLQDFQNICINECNQAFMDKQMSDIMHVEKLPRTFIKCEMLKSTILNPKEKEEKNDKK